MAIKITASLVLYNNRPEDFGLAIQSFLNAVEGSCIVVFDNSENKIISPILLDKRVVHLHDGKNIGFGAGHNRAFKYISMESDYHVVINPDIVFKPDVIHRLISDMATDLSIGAIMPKIVYPDGSPQHLCKLVPTPIDLILRRFVPIPFVQNKINRRYELHDLPQNMTIDVPIISGCFFIARSELFQNLNGFDERYFMYMEDVDLMRRIGKYSRVVYQPEVSVIHGYAKGSYRNKKLFLYHLKSAMLYFNKWGWIFDRDRALSNKRILNFLYKH